MGAGSAEQLDRAALDGPPVDGESAGGEAKGVQRGVEPENGPVGRSGELLSGLKVGAPALRPEVDADQSPERVDDVHHLLFTIGAECPGDGGNAAGAPVDIGQRVGAQQSRDAAASRQPQQRDLGGQPVGDVACRRGGAAATRGKQQQSGNGGPAECAPQNVGPIEIVQNALVPGRDCGLA